jgi:hypothetical protein
VNAAFGDEMWLKNLRHFGQKKVPNLSLSVSDLIESSLASEASNLIHITSSLARIMLTLELRITNANDVAGCLALDEAQGMVGCTLPESTEVEATFLRPNGRVSGT